MFVAPANIFAPTSAFATIPQTDRRSMFRSPVRACDIGVIDSRLHAHYTVTPSQLAGWVNGRFERDTVAQITSSLEKTNLSFALVADVWFFVSTVLRSPFPHQVLQPLDSNTMSSNVFECLRVEKVSLNL